MPSIKDSKARALLLYNLKHKVEEQAKRLGLDPQVYDIHSMVDETLGYAEAWEDILSKNPELSLPEWEERSSRELDDLVHYYQKEEDDRIFAEASAHPQTRKLILLCHRRDVSFVERFLRGRIPFQRNPSYFVVASVVQQAMLVQAELTDREVRSRYLGQYRRCNSKRGWRKRQQFLKRRAILQRLEVPSDGVLSFLSPVRPSFWCQEIGTKSQEAYLGEDRNMPRLWETDTSPRLERNHPARS